MDELKFREGLNRIIPTLKLFVAGFSDNGKSFVNYLNGLDKSLIQKFLDDYTRYKTLEKINRVRVEILKKLLSGSITLADINSIFDDEKSKWDSNVLKVWTVSRIIYPFCYGENKSEERFTGNFLLDLCDEIIEKSGYDRDKISKPGQINFDGATNFGKNGFYVAFGNNTHPDYTTMDQFRIESEGDNKLNVGIYHHGDGFVDGKYKSFDINSVTLQDIIDEAVVVKNDIESDIYSGDNIPDIIEYLRENVSKYTSKKEEAEEQRKVFLDKYPLEKLKNLDIEDYIYVKGKGNNEESFTKLLRCNSKSAVAIGELVENSQNFLFYKENGKYVSARVMDDYKKRAGGNVIDMFKLFISDTYDFINNFDENNYNQSDYIQGATYLKSAIFFFYRGDVILNIGSQNIAQSIANQFGIYDETDAIGYDILLSKYLNDNEPDLVNEYGFYAIGRCLYEYFKKYLKNLKKNNRNNLNYYAVGANLGNGDKQQEFYNLGKLIIGWQELGSLNQFNDENSLMERYKELGFHDAGAHFRQTFSLFKNIKKGDIVCVKSMNLQKKEMYIYAVGEVLEGYDSGYEFIDGLGHSLPVKRKILDEKYLINGAKYRKTLTKIHDEHMKDLLDKLLGNSKNISLSLNTSTMVPLNTILYGVPGTGKTFNTINYAVAIIEGKPVEEIMLESKNNRSAVKKRYEDYLQKGLIMFTTFHQSYGYEDFIEGIKASVDNGSVNYYVADGIFKKLCSKATLNNNVKASFNNSFSEAYDKFVGDISDLKEPKVFETANGYKFGVTLNSNGNLSLYTGKDLKKNGVLTKDNILKWSNGEKVFDGWGSYVNAILAYLGDNYGYSNTDNNGYIGMDNNWGKYVLIIDEINRGNISKIFGELITLLEPDKRLGGKEELRVKLPYSNKEFGVPNNLYVLGTMNTADRSIALIDLALRRRFSFKEMEPNSELLNDIPSIEGINIKTLFETMNKRIEFLYDRDHLLGHAYFLLLKDEPTLDKLNSIMLDKIIPLLQEYFHDDWEKIQMILGDHDNQNFKEDSDKIIQKKKNFDSESVLGFYDDDIEGESFIINDKLTVNSYLGIYKK